MLSSRRILERTRIDPVLIVDVDDRESLGSRGGRQLKIAVVGEAGVGKTSLIERFVHDTFDKRSVSRSKSGQRTITSTRCRPDHAEDKVAQHTSIELPLHGDVRTQVRPRSLSYHLIFGSHYRSGRCGLRICAKKCSSIISTEATLCSSSTI